MDLEGVRSKVDSHWDKFLRILSEKYRPMQLIEPATVQRWVSTDPRCRGIALGPAGYKEVWQRLLDSGIVKLYPRTKQNQNLGVAYKIDPDKLRGVAVRHQASISG